MDVSNIPDALTLPLRLKLVCALVGGKQSFGELKQAVQGTDGNISVQLSRLEEWGYIRSEKTVLGRRPRSVYEITPYGLRQLEEYIRFLQSILPPEK